MLTGEYEHAGGEYFDNFRGVRNEMNKERGVKTIFRLGRAHP